MCGLKNIKMSTVTMNQEQVSLASAKGQQVYFDKHLLSNSNSSFIWHL